MIRVSSSEELEQEGKKINLPKAIENKKTTLIVGISNMGIFG